MVSKRSARGRLLAKVLTFNSLFETIEIMENMAAIEGAADVMTDCVSGYAIPRVILKRKFNVR
jgi:hypothetical protein